MTLYFGEPWDAPVFEDATRTEVPTYARCMRCCELFADADAGLIEPTYGPIDPEYLVGVGSNFTLTATHHECRLAEVIGHLVGVCRCTGHEPSRDTAREVLRRVQAEGPRYWQKAHS